MWTKCQNWCAVPFCSCDDTKHILL
jgi:hypothetical protein